MSRVFSWRANAAWFAKSSRNIQVQVLDYSYWNWFYPSIFFSFYLIHQSIKENLCVFWYEIQDTNYSILHRFYFFPPVKPKCSKDWGGIAMVQIHNIIWQCKQTIKNDTIKIWKLLEADKIQTWFSQANYLPYFCHSF